MSTPTDLHQAFVDWGTNLLRLHTTEEKEENGIDPKSLEYIFKYLDKGEYRAVPEPTNKFEQDALMKARKNAGVKDG